MSLTSVLDDAWEYGSDAVDWLTTPRNGTTGIQDLLAIGGGLATVGGAFDSDPPKIGYQGKIPGYNAMQKLVPPNYDPNRMPGSYGQRYFTDIAYAGNPEEEAAADTALGNQRAVLQFGNAAQRDRWGPLLNNLGTRYSQDRAPLYEAPAGGIGDLPAGGINAAYNGPRTTRPADTLNKYPNQTPPSADALAFYKMIADNPEEWQAYVDSQRGSTTTTSSSPGYDPTKQGLTLGGPSSVLSGTGAPIDNAWGFGSPEWDNEAQRYTQPGIVWNNPAVPAPAGGQGIDDLFAGTYAEGTKMYPQPGGNYLAVPNQTAPPTAPTAPTSKYPNQTAPSQEVMDFLTMVGNDPTAWQAYVDSQNGFAAGGQVYGRGDGMSDSIPAMIEGQQPAALARDEFVVPADVVGHLGNGSTNAGAKELMGMMARIRKARTGTTAQGKQINPSNFLPS